MKTPYAILIGLALIAAAIFYREPSIKPALATTSAQSSTSPVMSCPSAGHGFGAGTWFCHTAYGGSLYTIPLDIENPEVQIVKWR